MAETFSENLMRALVAENAFFELPDGRSRDVPARILRVGGWGESGS
jgi:hypothetical protein